MKELELFEQKMTVKEIAEVLSLDERTVQLKVKELFPSLVVNGKKTLLDQKQVTSVKLDLEKKFEVKTDLEKELVIQQALLYQQEKINSMQLKLQNAENKLLEQAPKVEFFDKIIDHSKYFTMKEVSNMLAIPELGRNNLLKRLREHKYLTKFNKPYQKYIDQGLFKVIESSENGRLFASTVVSNKGIDRLIKVFSN